MGEKGSLKNKIKDFIRIREKKLKKKKEEELEKKKKEMLYYSRTKIFFIKIFSYLGLCISSLIFKDKKQNTNNENVSNNYKKENIQVKIKISNLEVKKINKQNIVLNKKPLNEPVIKAENKKTSNKTTIIKENHNKKENIKLPQISDNKDEKQNKLKRAISKPIIVGTLSCHFVKEVSKEIIESIQSIKENKEEFHNKPNQTKEINNFLEVKDNKKEQINYSLGIKDNKNDETIKDKIETKEDLEPFYIRTEEIKTAYKIVEDDILKQELEIQHLKENLKNVSDNEVKKIKLNYLKNSSFKLINFFNPFHYLFKNTYIYQFINSIIINHRIKKMRRVIQKKNQIKYYNIKKLLKEIVDKKDIIQKNIYINLNTLEEINDLKNDLEKENSNLQEITDILNDLKLIEKKITEKNKKLNEELEKTKELEEKGKVKIKEFNKSA